MKEQRRNEIKVGLTVVIGILILLIGFSVFKDWSIGRSEYVLRMHFPNSGGIAVGDQVSVNGVRSGKITSVALEDGGVRVDALIASDVVIRKDAAAVIQMLELMGGKKVEIRQGMDGEQIDAGTILYGSVDPDIAGALGMLGDMSGNVQDIGQQADSLLRNLNAVVGDEHFIRAMKETVTNLHEVSRELRSYMARNSDNINDLTVNLVSLTERVDTMLAELQPAVSGSLEISDRVLIGADSLITDVRGLLREIRDSRGLLHTAIHDTSLVTRMERMLLKLDTLTGIIIEGEFRTNIDLF
ncbi:MAG: MCE family protein [Bacteroidetes bacterium]|nr:MCE family protein [Bacteroidota bacterium]